MFTTSNIIIVVLVLVIVGVILGLVFSRRKRSARLHDQFGPEYDHAVQTMGGEKKAQTELEERQKHVKALDIRPLSVSEREHYLAGFFHDGGFDAALDERFGRLEADEAATYDDAFLAFADKSAQSLSVLDGLHRMDVFQVPSRNWGNESLSAGRYQKLVIPYRKFLARIEVDSRHLLVFPVNRGDFVVREDFEVFHFFEKLGIPRHAEQIRVKRLLFLNDSADVIRNPARGIRNEFALMKDRDFYIGVAPARF